MVGQWSRLQGRVFVCVCVLFSFPAVWDNRPVGVLKDRGIIGQAKGRKTWDWSKTERKKRRKEQNQRTDQGASDYEPKQTQHRYRHQRAMSRLAHKHIGFRFRPFFLAELQMCPLHLCPRRPRESVQNQHGKKNPRSLPRPSSLPLFILIHKGDPQNESAKQVYVLLPAVTQNGEDLATLWVARALWRTSTGYLW